MKANTPELMKFKRLQRRLGESRRGTIGMLESLWIEVSRNCPEGNVGKFSNEEIAIMVDWEGDPDALVDALVECRWLDVCSTHRLVVHDWADHCPTYVKGGLAKRGKAIAKASQVQAIGTSSEVQAEPSSEQAIASTSEVLSTKPSQVKPNQAKPSESEVAPQNAPSPAFGDEAIVPKSLLGDVQFGIVWDRWKRHRIEKCKPLGSIEEETQLMELSVYEPLEATRIVSYAISKGAVNLIMDGSHNAVISNSRTHKVKVSFSEGLLT